MKPGPDARFILQALMELKKSTLDKTIIELLDYITISSSYFQEYRIYIQTPSYSLPHTTPSLCYISFITEHEDRKSIGHVATSREISDAYPEILEPSMGLGQPVLINFNGLGSLLSYAFISVRVFSSAKKKTKQ